MNYDQKCEDLARHFLPSDTSEKLVQSLAQRIQDCVEDHIEGLIQGEDGRGGSIQ